MCHLAGKLRFCIVGAGRAGLIHAENIYRHISGCELAAVCDVSSEKTGEARMLYDGIDVFNDYRSAVSQKNTDAVVIVAPTKYHREIAVAAAENKKHVFCEKPMAMNPEECEEIINACKRNNVKLQVGFMRRFDSSFIEAKSRIDSGEIGKPVLIKSLTHGPSIPRPWMYDIRKSNGPLAEVSSHDIDTARWMSGSEFKTAYAIGNNLRTPDAVGEYPDYYDNVIMACRMENGVQAMIEGAVSVRYGYDARLEILGEKGILFVGKNNQDNVVVVNKENGIHTPHIQSWTSLFCEAYKKEMESFAGSIVSGREPEVTGFDGLQAVKAVNAGNESILSGESVSF